MRQRNIVRGVFSNPLTWIILVSICVRLLLWFFIPLIVTSDGEYYFQLSRNLFPPNQNGWFDPWYPPGYPIFLRLLFAFGGEHANTVLGAQSLLGILSAVIYFQIAKKVSGRTTAILTGLFLGLNPIFILVEHFLLTETIAIFFQGCTIFMVVGVWENSEKGLLKAGAAGLLMALTALVRPSHIIFPIGVLSCGLLLAVIKRLQNERQFALGISRAVIIMTLICSVVLSPWLLWNAIENQKTGLSSVSNIARLLFALREGFLPADDPELIALVPNLPESCRLGRGECGWLPVHVVRAQGKSEPQIDTWAENVLDTYLRKHPGKFGKAGLRVLGDQLGFVGDRWHELDTFNKFLTPLEYSSLMAQFHQIPMEFVQPERLGSFSATIAWVIGILLDWCFQWVPILFLFSLPLALSRRGPALLACLVLTMMFFLTILLAPVDRYMLLNLPLQWIVGCGGVMIGIRYLTNRFWLKNPIDSDVHELD
jgi:4-amino-4-deoxy-L-arabinose transferase-like glycosyltransferase